MSNPRKRKYVSSPTQVKKYKPAKIYRAIRSPMLQESHYVETYFADTSVTNTAVITCINQIAQGDTTINRAGNQVCGKYLQYNFQFKTTNTSPTNGALWIVLDRQSNASLPLISDILDSSTVSLFWAMKNIRAYQDRFKILRVHRCTMSSASGGGTVTNGVNDGSLVQGYIDMSKWPARERVVRFPGTSAGVPNTNALLVAYIADGPATSLNNLFGGFRYAYDEN